MDMRLKGFLILVVLAVTAFFIYPSFQAYLPGGNPEAIKRKVTLGLDLQGGMYLDVEVKTPQAVAAVLHRTTQELEDLFIDNHVDYTHIEVVGTSQVVIDLGADEKLDLESEAYSRFLVQYDKAVQPGQITLTLKSEEAQRIEKSAIDQALEVVRNRIDQLGVSEPSIQKQGENSILIQLPGLKNRDQAIALIGPQAVLEFYLVDDAATEKSHNPSTTVIKYQEVLEPITKKVVRREAYALEKKPLLTGEFIRDAQVRFDQMNQAYVALSFDSLGADKFGKLTTRYKGRRLAIVLDNKVQSAPVIREAITGGEASISGQFTIEEASNLALVLRSGSLPAPIEIREERTVGASLGEDSIRQGLMAALVGGAVVVGFMVFYYRLSGIFASVALVLNLFLILAAMTGFGATLTLPGIAGIALTLGMAVDANVLIFERIREEWKAGGNARAAIIQGFDRAFMTIFDSNLTTLFGTLALYQFGTGPIKGFAITLSIGILASMFTSIFVTRFFFDLVYLRQRKLQTISI